MEIEGEIVKYSKLTRRGELKVSEGEYKGKVFPVKRKHMLFQYSDQNKEIDGRSVMCNIYNDDGEIVVADIVILMEIPC